MLYLAQDNMSNAADLFAVTLQSGILQPEIIPEINSSLRYEAVGNGVAALCHNASRAPDVAVLIHCTCKLGEVRGDLEVMFDSATNILISESWPGVSRVFTRIRIMESTTVDVLMNMLQDDIRSRDSVRDVENPRGGQDGRDSAGPPYAAPAECCRAAVGPFGSALGRRRMRGPGRGRLSRTCG